MSFTDAIRTVVMEKYMDFSGRAPRSEYWWFVLAYFLLNLVVSLLGIDLLSIIVSLALLIPSIAVAIRRWHDIGKSGWWTLTLLIPLVNIILILVFFTRKGDTGPNQYGADPLAGT